jgi:hypothetical protein
MTFNLTDPTQLSAALQELNDRITQLATSNEHPTAQNQALNSQLRTAPPRSGDTFFKELNIKSTYFAIIAIFNIL